MLVLIYHIPSLRHPVTCFVHNPDLSSLVSCMTKKGIKSSHLRSGNQQIFGILLVK